MNEDTMRELLSRAGLEESDMDSNSTLAWNFAKHYMENETLVRIVNTLPEVDRLRLADVMLLDFKASIANIMWDIRT